MCVLSSKPLLKMIFWKIGLLKIVMRWMWKYVLFFFLQPANDHLHTGDEHELRGDKESYLCAVCLDVYFNPYMCYPCHHIFCEPCLRMLAKDNPASTPCPLCRTTIARVFFQTGIEMKVFALFYFLQIKIISTFPSCMHSEQILVMLIHCEIFFPFNSS